MGKWIVVLLAGVALVGVGLWLVLGPRDEAPLPDPRTQVETADGALVGFVDPGSGARVWRGVPFAAPPVGDLRWRAPRPAAAWGAPLDAVTAGPACVQFRNTLADLPDPDGDGIVGSEDCLYLNVYAPATVPPGEQLPVMVWIHGGGNSIGHAGPYHGGILAARHDVVVVAPNYRLGPFGWFSHQALRREELVVTDDRRWLSADGSGNYGTLDLLQGLAWVRENIRAFGGDPGNVTIFGESAGGTNVLSLMMSPLARGFFHRAIVQSGALRILPRFAAENLADDEAPGHARSSAEVMAALLESRGELSRDESREAVRDMTGAGARALLYGAAAAEIMALYDGGAMGMIGAPALFADGLVFPGADVMDLLSRRNYNNVPVILGSNRDEAKLFMALSPDWVERRFGFLPRLKDPDAYDRAARYASDAWKYRGVDSFARALRSAQGNGVYAYRFDWDEEGSVLGYDLSRAMGAAHGLEIAFVFGDFSGTSAALGDIYDEERLPARDALSARMMSYWTEFAYTGNPGRSRDGKGPRWLPWSNRDGAPRMLLFDTPEDGGIRMSAEEITLAGLKARFLADRSFRDQVERCETYAGLFRGSAGWDADEYATLGDGGCAHLPP